MSYLPNWPYKKPTWTEENIDLLSTSNSTSSDSHHLSLEALITKSEEFPIKFPIDVVRCKMLKNAVPSEILEKNINSAYPLIHENALLLFVDFLKHKRQFGNSIEREFYKNMSFLDFVERLLTKRAVMFMGRFDSYILMDGTKGSGKWDLIGSTNQKSILTINNCLTYDEIKLAVFLSVSSYSYFINDGTRRNLGEVVKNRENIQEEGIIVGVIGARLKKVNFMEYQEMVISKTQNTPSNGYGNTEIKTLPQLFLHFYEESPINYDTIEENAKLSPQRFIDVGENVYFDKVVYSKRIALSIDTLLIEANHRAKEKKTTAYVHVVGIGLGVWKCSPHQENIFVQTFANRLKSLGPKLTNISDVAFSYFNKTKSVGDYKNGQLFKIDDHPMGGINIHITKRNPHIKLTDRDEGKLLVVSYAWDGNSLPGNEFWSGKLGSTGDSAAAASTQITELHNPHINSKVSANNLRIATPNGLVLFVEYVNAIKLDQSRVDNP